MTRDFPRVQCMIHAVSWLSQQVPSSLPIYPQESTGSQLTANILSPITTESLDLLESGANCFLFRNKRFFQTMDQCEGSIAATASQVNIKFRCLARFKFAGCLVPREVMAYYFPQNHFNDLPGLYMSKLKYQLNFDSRNTVISLIYINCI